MMLGPDARRYIPDSFLQIRDHISFRSTQFKGGIGVAFSLYELRVLSEVGVQGEELL